MDPPLPQRSATEFDSQRRAKNDNPGAARISVSLPAAFAAACKFTSPLSIRAVHRVTEATQSFTVNYPFAFIGRAQGVGVLLDDPSVSQCHAYLQIVDGLPYCFDLGSRTGVFSENGNWGQEPVPPARSCRSGRSPSRSATSRPLPTRGDPRRTRFQRRRWPFWKYTRPPGRTDTSPLTDRSLWSGATRSCHLRFMDPEVSYFQCSLIATHDGVWFLDMPNRKGTTVNGRVARLTRLRDGDLLELGRVSLVLRDGP